MVVIALTATPLLADVVHLRGGGRITGEIVEQTAESVTVNIGGGNLSVGAGSVVVEPTTVRAVVVGSPARKVGERK